LGESIDRGVWLKPAHVAALPRQRPAKIPLLEASPIGAIPTLVFSPRKKRTSIAIAKSTRFFGHRSSSRVGQNVSNDTPPLLQNKLNSFGCRHLWRFRRHAKWPDRLL
jgi:hypothetical protein